MNTIEKLAIALEKNSLTATEIRKIGLKNPTDAIFRLRKQGYCIYANKNAKGVTSYKIGNASKAMVAELFATYGSAMYDEDFISL